MTRIIVVTGGVMSGIGKGHITASIGKMMQWRNYTVTPIKIDPYLNTDPGLMNPSEHGEIFVTDEVWEFQSIGNGDTLRIAELDQDFGSYERFLNQNMHPSQNISSGQVFTSILNEERTGAYLGKTVQMIPHVTDKIKQRIMSFAQKDNERKNPHLLLVEIGGTVGDIEGDLFLEAVRQVQLELGRENVIFVHTTLIPFNEPVQEFKTKPSQHSTQQLLSRGIFPDFIVCRSDSPIDEGTRTKIALFCNVTVNHVIDNPNIEEKNLYSLPLYFEKQLFGQLLSDRLSLPSILSPIEIASRMNNWKQIIHNFDHSTEKITIGIAGKYTKNKDAYKSIKEALLHAAGQLRLAGNITWIDTDSQADLKENISKIDGILVPGGFGSRGTEKKIEIAQLALEEKIPYLGICFGMQLATVAYARTYAGLKDANSQEIDKHTPHPIVTLQEEQKIKAGLGGTMRLGRWPAALKENCYVSRMYGNSTEIWERHRHRWEINNEYIPQLEKAGLIFSGFSLNTNLVEFIELPEENHIFFIGTQAHPEYQSRPEKPHPIYMEFIRKAHLYKENKKNLS
ncbi:MAG: CTP synthase [Candidatus Hodarchaeales archaeon]